MGDVGFPVSGGVGANFAKFMGFIGRIFPVYFLLSSLKFV